MKSFSKVFGIALVVWAGVGNGVEHAVAQTNTGPAPGTATPAPTPARQHGRSGRGLPGSFEFGGGTPREFILQAGMECIVDWVNIVTIPPEMETVMVPKMRLQIANAEELLKFYNRLGEQNPALGKWVWEGETVAPSVLMLVPAGNGNPSATNNLTKAATTVTEPPMEIRVFPLKYISGTNLATAVKAVEAVGEVTQSDAKGKGQTAVVSRVVVDERTASLLITGSPDFLNMAAKVLEQLDVPSDPRTPPPAPLNAPRQPDRATRQ